MRKGDVMEGEVEELEDGRSAVASTKKGGSVRASLAASGRPRSETRSLLRLFTV